MSSFNTSFYQKIKIILLTVLLAVAGIYKLIQFDFKETQKELSKLTSDIYEQFVYGIHSEFINLEFDNEEDFKPIHKLNRDLFVLNNYWDYEHSEWKVILKNLKNDSIHHSWAYYEKDLDFSLYNRNYSHAPTLGCILLEDKSIIVPVSFSKNLLRIDQNNKVKWAKHDRVVHHSSNIDQNGNIWSCSSSHIKIKGVTGMVKLDRLIQTDTNTGEIIFDKSIVDILRENNLEYLYHGSFFSSEDTAMQEVLCKNPTHLNDIEPVLNDGKYWKKGDLFLSLRNKSMVLQYRPSTNQIINIIQGGFLNQHDVDIISDHEIAVFNNNRSTVARQLNKHLIGKNSVLDSISCVVSYDFHSKTFCQPFRKAFEDHQIFSPTEGLYHFLENGDLFVEAQQQGKIYVFHKNNSPKGYETIYADYANSIIIDKYIELPHWLKVYESIDFVN